ncbi:MAG: hypothetical protein LAO79_04590 [Acidobacteriia bacterium]|nr:hypothetical protein [Terriglobia bacterium]
MCMRFERVDYGLLNSRQRENFNFAKLAAALADYGFSAMRLSDDWKGADLIAVHIDGEHDMKVQLKGRLTFDKKYAGKGIWVAFRQGDSWYLYDHDELFGRLSGRIETSNAWQDDGSYSWPEPPAWAKAMLESYRI